MANTVKTGKVKQSSWLELRAFPGEYHEGEKKQRKKKFKTLARVLLK